MSNTGRAVFCHVADAVTVDSKPTSDSCPEAVISGLVVTLNDDAEARARAVANISAHPAIRAGMLERCWLPVAVEARDQRESRDVHDWLMALDGVDYVDVVSVHFDSVEAEATTLA